MENFAGLEAPYSDYESAAAVVVPVPYDATSTWVRGADRGPEALLSASVALEWFDIETSSEVYLKGIHTAAPIREDASPEALTEAVQERISQLLSAGKFPLTIGGNHTVSIGAIRAMAKCYHSLSVLQLDAHSDLRPSYEGSELNHACVMYQAKQCASITQVGIRSMCVQELPHVEPGHIFYAHHIVGRDQWQQQAIDTLSSEVYITIDLDVFDPSVMPSTGTPEPGGLGYYEVLHFLRQVIATRNVVGIDLVELCPNKANRAPDFLAARLAYQLLTYRFSK